MSYKGLVVETTVGHKVPVEVLDETIKAFPSTWGYAAIVNDDGKSRLICGTEKVPPDTSGQDIQDILDTLPENATLFQHFGNYPEGFKDDCKQPFIALTSADDKPLLAIMMEGDFSHHMDEKDRAGFSPEYNCFKDYLGPKILELNDLLDGDLDKLMEKLRNCHDKPLEKELVGTFNDRGVITFIAANGEDVTVESNNDRLTFSWGTSSRGKTDQQESPPETPEETVEMPQNKPMTLAEKRQLKEQAARQAASGVHTTTATPKQFVKAADAERFNQQSKLQSDIKNADALPKTAPTDLITIRHLIPDIKQDDVETAKKAWNIHFGSCPDQYKLKQSKGDFIVNFTVGFPRAKLKPTSRLASPAKGFAALDAVATTPPSTPAGVPSVPAVKTPDTSSSSGPTTTEATVPVIPTQQRDKGLELIRTLDAKNNKIMSSGEIKNVEEKFNSFYAQMGTTIDETWKWSHKTILALCKQCPDLAYTWIVSLRNAQQLRQAAEQTAEKKPLTLAEKRAKAG